MKVYTIHADYRKGGSDQWGVFETKERAESHIASEYPDLPQLEEDTWGNEDMMLTIIESEVQ